MNASVVFSTELPATRNSLILIELTLRTFSAIISNCDCTFEFDHEALPTISPLKASEPEVTMKVALTFTSDAIGSANFFEVSLELKTTEFHPFGTEMLKMTSFTGAPVVFVNVTVVFCEDCGENVWSPGGVSVAFAGARLSRCTSYLAATTLS